MHQAALRPWSSREMTSYAWGDHGRGAGSLVPFDVASPDVPTSRRVLINGEIAARCSRRSGTPPRPQTGLFGAYAMPSLPSW
jgi:hypothetical protein